MWRMKIVEGKGTLTITCVLRAGQILVVDNLRRLRRELCHHTRRLDTHRSNEYRTHKYRTVY